MKKNYLLILFFAFSIICKAQFPYTLNPSWISQEANAYSTGLALVDINNDGWKDIVIANGNDMAKEHLVVYYNKTDGTFANVPDWSSADIDYHGHIAAGDFNKDGFTDIAVSVYIGNSSFTLPGKLKVYYNNAGVLESNPSFISEPIYTFSCNTADMDADGDLDLIAAVGDAYNNLKSSCKIYYNNNGLFDSIANWNSKEKVCGMDIECLDIDNNGFLDMFLAAELTPCYAYFADSIGKIDTIADWQTKETIQYANSVDYTFKNNKAVVAFTNNNQLGGDGKIRLYEFNSNQINASDSAKWVSETVSNASGILFDDLNNDNIVDLAFGGWWNKLKIKKGLSNNYFNLTNEYISSSSSVVEAIQSSDLNKDGIYNTIDTFFITKNNSNLIHLNCQNFEKIDSIFKNGNKVLYSEYCFSSNHNWVSFNNKFLNNDTIIVYYQNSIKKDIVISNWDNNKGNFIFYNQQSVDIFDVDDVNNLEIKIYPSPAENNLTILLQNKENAFANVEIFNINGILVKQFELENSKTIDISDMSTGVYFVKSLIDNKISVLKFVKL